MRVVDTSVVIAAFASWHESHAEGQRQLATRPQIVGHSMLEVFSVLTRLPAPHRAPGGVVAEFLARAFSNHPLALSGEEARDLVATRLAAKGIAGGACYDALTAETARKAGGTLVSLDRRALATYERMGCAAELAKGG